MEVCYRSKAVEGAKSGRLALQMMLVGMLCMVVALALSGGNILAGALGLVLPILWMRSRRVLQLECGVSPEGIRETWLDGQGAPVTDREHRHPWSSVDSWIIDEDEFRDVGKRRFVEIRFRSGHRIRFRAGDGEDPQETFEAFAAAFTRCAQPATGPAPRRLRSFYEKPLGKVVSVALSLLTLGLIYVGFVWPEAFPDTGWWQLSILLVPTCGYMIWRSFVSP